MISITQQEVTPEILRLFDLGNPTMPRAFNVLEGVIKGQIVVDHPDKPQWAVVREAIYGTLYFGGQTNSSAMPSVFEHFFPIWQRWRWVLAERPTQQNAPCKS